MADAAATVIANAVTVQHPGIERRPASSLKDDSDLGDIEVTVAVATLPRDAVARALRSGASHALQLRDRGLVHAAVLVCQGQALAVEPAAAPAELGSVFA